jgi:hypothetical protein
VTTQAPAVPQLQFDKLSARECDAHSLHAEIHHDRDLAFDLDNAAQAVLIMCDPITPFIGLDWHLDDADTKRASGQSTSSCCGARWLHYSHGTRTFGRLGSRASPNRRNFLLTGLPIAAAAHHACDA